MINRYSGMEPLIAIEVEGEPLPKQSFRAAFGGGYTEPRIKAWQDTVGWRAREVMAGRAPYLSDLAVSISFWRRSRANVDLDNLAKLVLDSLNGIVWQDDHQVVDLHLAKYMGSDRPGVLVEVYPDATDYLNNPIEKGKPS